MELAYIGLILVSSGRLRISDVILHYSVIS